MTAGAYRYAIYLAPTADSPWGRFSASWLGRCAAGGHAQDAMSIDGVNDETFVRITAEPRRYGFHATLKAPFRLAPGRTLASLVAALEERFSAEAAFDLPQLEPRLLDTFLALVPSQPTPDADRIAETCVRAFDAWRAPLTERESARRLAAGLDERGQELLAQWGYPSVLDRFRLHFSLSGALDASMMACTPRLLDAVHACMPRTALPFDAICLFEERAPGADFQLIERIALAAGDRVEHAADHDHER